MFHEEDSNKNTSISSKDLEEIKQAAREGAREGAKGTATRGKIGFFSIIRAIIVLAIIFLVVYFASHITNPFSIFKDQFKRESSANSHDLVLEDDGLIGYTAADFAEAILGDQSKLIKLEVLNQKISDATTITDTGLINLKIFSKTQLITYHGTATYTIDLSKLTKEDFSLDEENKTLIVTVPYPELEPINIQSSDIEFGNTEKGLLAFGDIKMTGEESSKVQSFAQKKMEEKLQKEDIASDAERFGKLAVWELFQPIINNVAKGYSLEIKMQ